MTVNIKEENCKTIFWISSKNSASVGDEDGPFDTKVNFYNFTSFRAAPRFIEISCISDTINLGESQAEKYQNSFSCLQDFSSWQFNHRNLVEVIWETNLTRKSFLNDFHQPLVFFLENWI